MDTTMIVCDSVAKCVNKTAGICQHCIKGTETSNNDVAIVLIICGTILLLAIIVALMYFLLKLNEQKALQTSAKNADEDSGSKKKNEAEYISRLLKHLESLTVKENVGKYDEIGSKRYVDELKHLIKTGEVTDEK